MPTFHLFNIMTNLGILFYGIFQIQHFISVSYSDMNTHIHATRMKYTSTILFCNKQNANQDHSKESSNTTKKHQVILFFLFYKASRTQWNSDIHVCEWWLTFYGHFHVQTLHLRYINCKHLPWSKKEEH